MKKTFTSTEAVQLLDQIRELLELQGENPFRIRAFEKASNSISKEHDLAKRVEEKTLTEIDGVGKGISEILTEYYLKGESSTLKELQKDLPEGLTDLVRIPGVGPKKARQLIEELSIHSVQELEYACKENRLLKLKGFGEKVQAKILSSIQFFKSTQGFRLLGDVYAPVEALKAELKKELNVNVECVGEAARKLDVISEVSYLIESSKKDSEKVLKKAKSICDQYQKKAPLLPKIEIQTAEPNEFGGMQVKLSSSPEHWKAIGSPTQIKFADELSFYSSLKLPLIAPEFRETGEEVKLAKKLDQIVGYKDIRGVFHNHTDQSDGISTLEEMVVGAIERGYEYIGISDHSQSAFYANGLKEDALKAQEKAIRKLEEKYSKIRIFWGIESDILQEGELDYNNTQLKRFDFVIGSIHQRFKLDRDQMTNRIIQAIRHPSIQFIGHLTGRLLLGRPGYDIDIDKILKEAEKHNVAIELNANPQRLDIDWRHGKQIRDVGTLISINPDAHSVEGLDDTFFGIAMARKALLTKDLIINTRSTKEVEKWLKRE